MFPGLESSTGSTCRFKFKDIHILSYNFYIFTVRVSSFSLQLAYLTVVMSTIHPTSESLVCSGGTGRPDTKEAARPLRQNLGVQPCNCRFVQADNDMNNNNYIYITWVYIYIHNIYVYIYNIYIERERESS